MRSADIGERMRCAVYGCSPVYCAICFRPSGSGCCDRTSSSFIMRSITWIGFFASSRGVAAIPHCKMRRHACGCEFMVTVTNIDDLREMAKKRVARAIFEYVDCGAYTECTLRANRADIEALGLRQRVGIDVARRSTKPQMLGREVTMPVALAPVGLLGLNWANGEILAARAANKFGVPFTLSTMSICSIEA